MGSCWNFCFQRKQRFYYVFSLKVLIQVFVTICHFLCLHFLQRSFLLLKMAQRWAVLAALLFFLISPVEGLGKWERSKTTCSLLCFSAISSSPVHWNLTVHQGKFCLWFNVKAKSDVTSASKIIMACRVVQDDISDRNPTLIIWRPISCSTRTISGELWFLVEKGSIYAPC